MKNKTHENVFMCFYLWATGAKLTMGIVFAYYAFMYLFFGIIALTPPKELGFFTALEMLFAAFFIGVAQQLLMASTDKFTKLRGFLWALSSTIITAVSCLVFKWFAGFPLWCFIAFLALAALGLYLMVYYYHLQLIHETKLLNKKLEQFQNRRK